MTTKEIMTELAKMGSESTRKIFANHGAPKEMFGVKVGDMKTIVKKVKLNHTLAMELYDTGNSDAMYLAGLISEPDKMSKKDLQHWAENASWQMISEYAVAWTAAESPFAVEMANKWIKSKVENIACAGWSTYSSFIGITPNDELDIKEISGYIDQIEKGIHQAPNRVRYCMNNFLISAGGYIPELRKKVIEASKKIGKIHVDLGGTACKVPEVKSYIEKMVERGSDQKKRKTAKC
jgi:3-methyladenine DNA glycosylase AlkD